jgi:hypothetical protein
MNGTFGGTAMQLPMDHAKSEYGETTAGLEFSYPFGRFIPYFDASTRYEYLRANDGLILSGDLTMVHTPGWTGMARFGGRLLLGGTTFLEIGGGYLSFFQRGLNAWETRIFLSQGF